MSENQKFNVVTSNSRGNKNYDVRNGIAYRKCEVCDNTNYPYIESIGARFCSWGCYEQFKKFNTKPNTKCCVCGKEFYLKQSKINSAKEGIACSNDCKNKLKSQYMSGSGNHQHGLIGDKNASFIGKQIINQYGYVMIYLPDHPKANSAGRYREHRYVVENNLSLDDSFFYFIGTTRILKDEYIVHHIDNNKKNNVPENLIILTRNNHTSEHNKDNTIIRDDLGRIIGVIKSRELLETLEEDNQQPSISSNTFEGSTTNSRVQTDNAEDSNANTSAGQLTLF